MVISQPLWEIQIVSIFGGNQILHMDDVSVDTRPKALSNFVNAQSLDCWAKNPRREARGEYNPDAMDCERFLGRPGMSRD